MAKTLPQNLSKDAEVTIGVTKSSILVTAEKSCVDPDHPEKVRAKLPKQSWKLARMEVKRDVVLREDYLGSPVSIIPCRGVQTLTDLCRISVEIMLFKEFSYNRVEIRTVVENQRATTAPKN